MHAKPFLKWAGGKSKIINEIHQHMDSKPLGKVWDVKEGGRYIEPFSGSSAAFLGLKSAGVINSQKVILADINEVLVITHQTIANSNYLDSVISMIKDMESKFFTNKHEYYYSTRDYLNEVIIPNPSINPIETAAHMIFINKTCFNGLWRINSKGHFNTPLGKPSSGVVSILEESKLREFSHTIGDVDFLNQDWRVTISLAGEKDLMYVDPPYLPFNDDEYVFRDYSGDGFSNKTHEDLARECARAAARGALVIISNNYSKKIEMMYKDAAKSAGARIARTRKIKLKRTMKKVSGGQRQQIEEILVFMAPK